MEAQWKGEWKGGGMQADSMADRRKGDQRKGMEGGRSTDQVLPHVVGVGEMLPAFLAVVRVAILTVLTASKLREECREQTRQDAEGFREPHVRVTPKKSRRANTRPPARAVLWKSSPRQIR